MKVLTFFLLFVLCISVVRVALGEPPISAEGLFTFFDDDNLSAIDLKQTIADIKTTVFEMLASFDIGKKLELIWADVDVTNFGPKVFDSIIVFLDLLNDVLNGVFVTTLNILKFPLQGIVFILRFLAWICGINLAF